MDTKRILREEFRNLKTALYAQDTVMPVGALHSLDIIEKILSMQEERNWVKGQESWVKRFDRMRARFIEHTSDDGVSRELIRLTDVILSVVAEEMQND